MQYYLVFKDEKSNKFWSLVQEGESFAITFGKVGTAGQSQQKTFVSAEAAQKEAEKLAAAKRKKGYVDAEAPKDAPAPKNPPVVKQAKPAAPQEPPAGPAPLADDGKPKPWHESEDEGEGRWFAPERLRQGLDETAKDDMADKLEKAADPRRLKRVLAKYEKEDNAQQAFITACIYGDFDNAVFLYETVIKPLEDGHRMYYLRDGAEQIMDSWSYAPGDLELLHWIFREGGIGVDDIDVSTSNPMMEYYLELAEDNADLQYLETKMAEKLDAAFEESMQIVALKLRELADHVRTGAPFEAKNTDGLSEMLCDGRFAKGTYGLRLKCHGESFYIRVLGNGNPSDYVCVALPALEDISHKYGRIYLNRLLPPLLEAMGQEGVFDGLFEDAIFIKEQDSGEILYKKVTNPAAAATLQAQIEQLETGEDWEENAKLLPLVVPMVEDGVFEAPDDGRALQLVLRHLRCPNENASEAAEKLLNQRDERPQWLYELALWNHDNFFFQTAADKAKKLFNKLGYAPGEELVQKFKLAAKRRDSLQLEGTPATFSGTNLPQWNDGPFEETFKEQDLFIETPNIIARAYKSGDIVLRFLVEGEEGYGEALDFINALLAKGYAKKAKNWTSRGGFALRVRFLHKPIAIKQMEKATVNGMEYPFNDAHAFFARAVQYPVLRPKVEKYAQLALQDFHWYTDLYDEDNTVPGTFAATALGFCGLEYMPIVCHYASKIDDEHTYCQVALPRALLKHYGVVPEVLPALFALSMSNGQDNDIKLPRNLMASSGAAGALLAYVHGLDMPKQSQMEYMNYTLTAFMSGDEERNLKNLREYAAVAADVQEKGELTELHNLYLEYLLSSGYEELGMPLPAVEGYVPSTKDFAARPPSGQNEDDGDVEIEIFDEPLPSIMTLEEAAAAGIVPGETDEDYDDYDVPVSIFCSPAVQTDFELLHFTRTQWEIIGVENQKGSERRCWARVLSGNEWMKMGNWIVDTHRFAANFALILFDGENKPLVLYGALDALNATLDFNAAPPKTPQEVEKLRLRHLRYPSALRNTSAEELQADKLLDEVTGQYLTGDFSRAEPQLRAMKPEGSTLAYLASRVMLAYLAQRRGYAEELAELCVELMQLQPEKRDFWLAKQALAQSV